MPAIRKNSRSRLKKLKKCRGSEQAVLSVVSVRISDAEKEHIDGLIRAGVVRRYSDVLRMAIQMIPVQINDESAKTVTYH